MSKNNTIYATAVPVADPIPYAPTDQCTKKKKRSTKNAPNYMLDRYHPTSNKGQESVLAADMVEELVHQGFTYGLAHSLTKNKRLFPIRFWILDNSGSMSKPDGHRIVATTSRSDVKFVPTTRWVELRETAQYHIRMAGLIQAPSCFRLLNDSVMGGPQHFSVHGDYDSDGGVDSALAAVMQAQPQGCTPLTAHINDIYHTITNMASSLRASGQRAVIVIATDGLPSNTSGVSGKRERNEFVRSLRRLEGLPIWLVIRLCTDDDDVVDFYNNLDEELELSLDVLDDFCAEAKEVHEHNSWLNYALPLHRLREMGFYDRTFDLIDERALTIGELREFLGLLFGQDQLEGLPEPALDWMTFSMAVENLNRNEPSQWNPIKKRVGPWIDMRQLNRQYGSKGCAPGCTIM